MEQNLMTGHTLNQMRLMVEGALMLFENETGGYYKHALDEGRTDEALAFDMLGTTLHELQQHIRDLQVALVKTNS